MDKTNSCLSFFFFYFSLLRGSHNVGFSMVDIPSFSAEFRNRAPESSGPTGELRSTAPRRRCFHRDPVTMVARSAVGYRLHIRLNSGNTLFNVFNVFMSLPGHSPWWRKTSKLTDGKLKLVLVAITLSCLPVLFPPCKTKRTSFYNGD